VLFGFQSLMRAFNILLLNALHLYGIRNKSLASRRGM
jgi:hypothetical protein